MIETKSTGSKYNRDLDITEIAKLIRKDIAQAIKDGLLPEIKTSVRIERFSMGQAIRLSVKSVPAWFRIWTREFVAFEVATDGRRCYDHERFTPAARACLRRLSSIMAAYNYDDSDSTTDHFDVNFYGSPEFDYRLTRTDREAIEAEVRSAA